MTPLEGFKIYVYLVASGVVLETFLSRTYYFFHKSRYKKHHFFFGKYLYLLLFPSIAFLYITNQFGYPPVTVFAVFAVLGTILEGLVGFSYHTIVGQRLWTYHKYSIFGYTSLLGAPIWGLLGILTWLLAKAFI